MAGMRPQERLWIFPKVNRPVFLVSALLSLAFIVFGAIFSDFANTLFTGIQGWLAGYLGWAMIVLVNALLVFVVFLALGPFGDVRLGRSDESPEYSLFSWTSMLFSAGIGIGLIYWGVAEPMYHFFAPPNAEPEIGRCGAGGDGHQLHALGFPRLGDLCGRRVGAGLFPLPQGPAAGDPLGPVPADRRPDLRTLGRPRRHHRRLRHDVRHRHLARPRRDPGQYRADPALRRPRACRRPDRDHRGDHRHGDHFRGRGPRRRHQAPVQHQHRPDASLPRLHGDRRADPVHLRQLRRQLRLLCQPSDPARHLERELARAATRPATGRTAGPSSTGPGGSAGRPSSACSSRASAAGARSANSSSA